jgi:hypothetical protein
MLKFNIRRSPLSDHSYSAEKTFEASLSVGHVSADDPTKWLDLRFATGTDGKTSLFEGAIMPRHFANVVEMMMEIDPEATIHAMGKALQTARVQGRSNETASDEAA